MDANEMKNANDKKEANGTKDMNDRKDNAGSLCRRSEASASSSQERKVEICAGGLEDCVLARQYGADRVELNSALALGGLTPTTTLLRQVKQKTGLEVICMVRPRPAGFCYDKLESELMMEEARDLLEAGADGIAFGFLTEDGQVDAEKTRAMADLIHSFGKTAVFHRAIDVVASLSQAMEMLKQCGIDRVLTSGMEKTAEQGAETIAWMQKHYGDAIEILAGSGISFENARSLMEKTGIFQVHASCQGTRHDKTTQRNGVSYACMDNPYAYPAASGEKIAALVQAVKDKKQ